MKSINAQRISRAKAALDIYIEEVNDPVPDPDEVYLTDLLTDLMHHVGREEFSKAVRMAEIHYDCEITGKE